MSYIFSTSRFSTAPSKASQIFVLRFTKES
jgi:hypothetical protein